jgi:hypothetical protein
LSYPVGGFRHLIDANNARSPKGFFSCGSLFVAKFRFYVIPWPETLLKRRSSEVLCHIRTYYSTLFEYVVRFSAHEDCDCAKEVFVLNTSRFAVLTVRSVKDGQRSEAMMDCSNLGEARDLLIRNSKCKT